MVRRMRPCHRFAALAALTALVAGSASVLTFAGHSAADLASLAGGAVGESVNIALQGAAPITSGPLPSVTLPPSGQAVDAAADSAAANGPDPSSPFQGRFLETGALSVNSKGAAGYATVTSSAAAADVDALAGALKASQVRSQCNSLGGEASGWATVAGATMAVSETDRITLPDNPAPNTPFGGTDAASGTSFRVVLNEQTPGRGSITVTAVHVILDGPSARGDIIIGRSWCATAAPGEPPSAGSATPSEAGAPAAAGKAPTTGEGGKAASAVAGAPAGAAAVTQAAATEVKGSACGYFVHVGLFGGPQDRRGCGQRTTGLPGAATSAAPFVELPPGGSPAPISQHDADGAAGVYGPATIFGGRWVCEDPNTDPDKDGRPGNCPLTAPPSGPMTATVEGSAAAGTVTASADIVLLPTPTPVKCWDGWGPECVAIGGFGPYPVEGDEMHVKCTASDTAVTGSVTIKNGVHATTTDAEGNPKDQEGVPENPPPNYTRSGVISNVGDVFTAVYNEHVINDDGSLTVNGVHLYLFGPVAVGEMVKGQATCGRNPAPASFDRTDTRAPSCGKLVVEPVGPEDPTPKIPRTELIGVFDSGGLQSIDNINVTNGDVSLGKDPNSPLPYLTFQPGQKTPLTMTATRRDEAQPMTWSFEAKDKAGNVTSSTACPTDSPRIDTPIKVPGTDIIDTSVNNPTNPTNASNPTGASNSNTRGGGANAANATGGRMATTGANAGRLGAFGGVALAVGAGMVLSSRRRRRGSKDGDGNSESDVEGDDPGSLEDPDADGGAAEPANGSP